MRVTVRCGVVFAIAISTGAACGSTGSPIAPSPTTMSAAMSTYLEQMLDIMQTRSLRRSVIDWPALRASARASAPAAQTTIDLVPAIRTAIRLLGDGHSFYQFPSGGTVAVPTRSCNAGPTAVPVVPASIGYVKVGAFSGSGAAATAFADTIQSTIATADQGDITGWVVDLRGNGGGNMWPMVAGLGPLLGDGVFGHFIDPIDGVERVLEYRDGIAMNNGTENARVSTPYRLRRAPAKVAVLTDVGVASSGEATAIAFRQRANTRSFGTPTCGLSTSNAGIPLSDGATLYLTIGVQADRTKTLYGDVVVPDETITDQAELVSRAIAWLQAR